MNPLRFAAAILVAASMLAVTAIYRLLEEVRTS